MPWDEIRSNWDRFRERVRSRWGRLADLELDAVDGDRERLVETIARAYGIGRERAERQVMEFEGEERRGPAPPRRGDGGRRPGRDEEE